MAPHHCSLPPAPSYPYSRGHKVLTEPRDGLPEKVGHPEADAPRARPLVSDGDVRRGSNEGSGALSKCVIPGFQGECMFSFFEFLS